MCASFSYGQMKIVSDGDAVVGNATGGAAQDPGKANLKSMGSSELEFALDALVGNADFTMQIQGISKAQFKYNTSLKGIEFLADAGSTSDFGLAGSKRAMFIDGSNQFVGIGTASPSSELDVHGTISHNGTTVHSDKRLKKNVQDLELGLEAVLALNPISYEYNGKAGTKDGDYHIGIFAQELQKVAPSLVGEAVHTNYSEYSGSEEASQVISEESYLYIKDNEIKYLLVNAIKSQQELIEAQGERISQMEEVINSIGSTESINNTNVTLSSYDLAEIDQNNPNPFNNSTTISYVIPTDSQNAQIRVYGQNGQLMKTLDIDHVGQGTLTVNAQDLPSGTYSYQLVVDDRSIQTKKMVVTK